MYRKPNEYLKYRQKSEDKKRNQIGRRFSEIFDILLNPSYYEGTKFAEYFNRLNDDGKNMIYVYDSLEKELDQMIGTNRNLMKYLVGLSGMGKTTLLRNYFRITDRDVKIEDNKIIIYISLYYADMSVDNPHKSVENEIVKYFARTVRVLLTENSELVGDEDIFWEGLYDFIEKNKPTLLESERITPSSFFLSEIKDGITLKRKHQRLNDICSTKPIEYYSSFIKYILMLLPTKYNIVILYDDIESKERVFHRPFVEIARHVHSCFNAIEDKERTVKTIVTLRAYTFRSNIERQSDARREAIRNNTILKKDAVKLHDIFEVRFKEIEEIEQTENNSKDINNYREAKRQLSYVEQRLNNIGSDLIYNLANYDLCNAMLLYCQVLTNVEWIASGESEKSGGFRVNNENYQLTAENIIYAIANGNSKEYVDNNDNYIPNLLKNDKEGTDLIGLYIIYYLKNKQCTSVYGVNYVEGEKILSDIMGLFVSNSDSEARIDNWRYKILCVLEHLYDSGILLRSLYDIEDTADTQIERKYSNTFKLYLAPRGVCLYNLLSRNAVLLELYRDDIYTNLYNNDKMTYELKTKDLFVYLMDYLDELFEIEKRNIGSATSNLEKYQELLGSEFITVILLEGIVRNLGAYFKEKGNDYEEIMERVYKLRDKMQYYSKAIQEKYNICFSISKYLETCGVSI